MKVFITGGSGFVGQHLTRYLLEKGCHVISAGRSATISGPNDPNFTYISADTTKEGDWQERIREVDAIVNLAGVNIFNYWTKKYKQAIYNSRIETTRNLVNAIPENSSISLISTSAQGFYGDRGDDRLTEEETPGDDFLAKVCIDWEKEALKAREKNARVAIMRFGVVADKSGGAMKMMLPPFKLFVGGPLGNGQQWFPWIHLQDLIAALWFVLENRELEGPFNCVSPNPVRNKEMAKTIGRLLRRPVFFKVPGFAIRLVIGELGSMVLFSQRGQPARLEENGFIFSYPDFESALKEILEKT